jgi:hypothetical protein
MKTFRDACRKNPLPRERDFDSDKNAYASALEACHDNRKKKCPSYIPLWISCGLKDHPKYSSVGKMESGEHSDSSAFEGTKEGGEKTSDSSSDASSRESHESSSSDEEDKMVMVTSPKSGNPSPAASPAAGGAAGGLKRTASGTFRKGINVKKRKFSLRKGKSTTKHQDIVEAYLLCKHEQNEHFLHLGILAQRRGVFFECWDRGITEHASIQRVFNTIGIGTIPAQFQPTLEAMQEDESNGQQEGQPLGT